MYYYHGYNAMIISAIEQKDTVFISFIFAELIIQRFNTAPLQFQLPLALPHVLCCNPLVDHQSKSLHKTQKLLETRKMTPWCDPELGASMYQSSYPGINPFRGMKNSWKWEARVGGNPRRQGRVEEGIKAQGKGEYGKETEGRQQREQKLQRLWVKEVLW